jgi:hypothetical protein
MNGKYKVWIVFSLIAVFILGITTGYFSERYLIHKRFEQMDGREDRRPHHPPTIEALAKALNLDQGQQDRIREAFRMNEERLKAFGEEYHKQLNGIRAQLKTEIDAILTPEQKQKMEALIRESNAKRKDSNGQERREPSRPQDKGDRK